MKRQIKIVIEYDAEGIDCDQTSSLSMAKVQVYHDDERVGAIQTLKLLVTVNDWFPEFEITFPNTDDWPMDDPFSQSIVDAIHSSVRVFSKIPGVVVKRS